jgi:hypothetical protein
MIKISLTEVKIGEQYKKIYYNLETYGAILSRLYRVIYYLCRVNRNLMHFFQSSFGLGNKYTVELK